MRSAKSCQGSFDTRSFYGQSLSVREFPIELAGHEYSISPSRINVPRTAIKSKNIL